MSPNPPETQQASGTGSVTGLILLATTLFVLLSEWTGSTSLRYPAAIGVALFIAVSIPYVRWSRLIFIIVAIALTLSAYFTNPNWWQITNSAMNSAAFIAAFFTALTSLRSASATSPSIEKCGHFLAEQPPGRRYLALTTGGHLFALVLNYGAISLLGNLAEVSARREPNEEIRNHRLRRMLLAIQRGFISTLPWSPLTFAIAISTSLVPGATWAGALAYCLGSALILAGIGWAMDAIFKPRLTVPVPQRQKPQESWTSLLPLLVLLALLAFVIGTIHLITGIRAVGVVMLVVPLVSVAWIAIQNLDEAPFKQASQQIHHYISSDLPGYTSELVLLAMAGFIGTIGAQLLGPMVAGSHLDMGVIPGWLLLVSLVWIIPIAGQLGMNPILSVSLLAPLLPTSAQLGVSPAGIVTAITAGWALSGASSPFTATTMLVGNVAGVSAWRVGLKWNGAYSLVCAVALSVWVAIVALHFTPI